MALTHVQSPQSGHIQMGQNGRVLQWGTFTFTTTDLTGSLETRVRQVEACFIQPINAGADEVVYGPSTALGPVVVGSSGTITITRTGTPTSGLVCQYLIIGR